ncbi:MAG: dockerin type I domain-containing protein [Euryarchaeota archaeon]|nr:dockerin type I domain-containing protein [Euryarchaeota archaeon]
MKKKIYETLFVAVVVTISVFGAIAVTSAQTPQTIADASADHGLMTTIEPDTTSPIITGVVTSSVTITWTTDEASDSLVRYGTESGDYTDEKFDAAMVTAHEITLTSLSPGTTYYFVAVSTDANGNAGESVERNFTTASNPAPYILVYTITNSTIVPNGDGVMDDTAIDLEFSEPVNATILIENETGIIRMLYVDSCVSDPDPQVWDGTDDGGNAVSGGTYQVNVTMDDSVNPIVHNNSRSIEVVKTDVAIIKIDDAIGTVATLPITIENGVNVGACDIILTYDPMVVNVTNVTSGDFGDTVVNLEHACEGSVRIGTYQTNNPGLSGDIVFASVTLEDVRSAGGTSPLNLGVVTFKDATPEGNPMPYITRNGTYTAAMNGDVDGDGIVDMHDAMYLAKHVLGITGFTEITVELADVDGDGRVDMHDAMYLAKYVVGIGGYEDWE